MSVKREIACVVLGLIFLSGLANALLIKTAYSSDFSDNEKACIADAVKEWADLLPCSDGFQTTITFACDNSLTALGLTSNWALTNGRPTSAQVTIKNNAHNWTLGNPISGMDDALDTLKHEVGHALGFTVLIPAFANHVITVAGNRFYDVGGDEVFNNSDMDLVDDPSDGTHTPTGLMAPSTPAGIRNHPTSELAYILHDAYGYCIPEPMTLSLLALGGLLLRRRRKSF